ncbi:iron-containing alcohol dehydrogenase [Escherichia coli]|nr:iron-containing alcohol dehydrogenase [Escherichia coli]QGJ60111.1 iron-containing alcohol dehydrogenase [Escherichia coli]
MAVMNFDANLVMDMPKSLCAFGGLDAVTHAMEAGYRARIPRAR